jgi:hypothetical protein
MVSGAGEAAAEALRRGNAKAHEDAIAGGVLAVSG